jgi:leucyl aminopeptidase (aminopeptidase T)
MEIIKKVSKEILAQNDLVLSIAKIYDECFNLKSNERVLIASDRFRINLGQMFYDIAHTKIEAPVLTIVEKGEEHIPKDYFEKTIEFFDVIILLGNISYHDFRVKAIKLGKRVATLPHINEEVLKTMLPLNLKELHDDAEKFASKLESKKTIRVTSRAGTDIILQVKGQKIFKNDGDLSKSGMYENVPPGEVYLSPIENTAQGTIVVDGSFPLCGLMKSPLTMYVQDGFVTRFNTNDHELAGKLDEKFLKYGKNVGNVAELGIGISKVANLVGVTLEDEKMLGTIHIAIGANSFMGGSIDLPVHLDGVIKNPTLRFK